jgi:hypothetical protein
MTLGTWTLVPLAPPRSEGSARHSAHATEAKRRRPRPGGGRDFGLSMT